MPEMLHFPTDPSDPVEGLDIQSPEDLSAYFCDQFDAIHRPEWTAYLWTDPPQPDAYNATDRNDRAAAFLNAHAADGRTPAAAGARPAPHSPRHVPLPTARPKICRREPFVFELLNSRAATYCVAISYMRHIT